MATSIAKIARPAFPGFDPLIITNISDHAFDAAPAPGDTVVIDIGGLTLPENYSVSATASVAAIASVTNKTGSSFRITLSPLSADDTIPAGSIDLVVVAL